MSRKSVWFVVVLLTIQMLGCGSDEAGAGPECGLDERYNPILDACEPARTLMNNTDDMGEDVSGEVDMGENPEPDMSETDMAEEDSGPDLPDGLTCLTDLDGDGHYAMECGGDDCDDTNRSRSPSATELCDRIDNDCNDEINDGIDCTFYAHSNTTLYRIDPFKFTTQELGSVPGLFDIDTHPDGTLYGLTSSQLYTYDPQSGMWTAFPNELGVNLGTANGMAIDEDGTAYVTGGNTLYTVDLTNGSATAVGSGNYNSSGDTVITKQGVLYMTSSRTLNTDTLVLVEGSDGSGDLVGATNHRGIWGLTAAWGDVYGLTEDGELIAIDSQTGASTLLHQFGISFYGAASTPNR